MTIDELKILFQSWAILSLGITFRQIADPENPEAKINDPEDKEPYRLVRLAWPTQGQPDWAIGDDTCFVRVLEEDDTYNRQRYRELDERDTETLWYTKVIGAYFILYGPHAYERASLLKDRVFDQLYRDVLAREKVFLLPDVGAPVRSPEIFQGQWWERANLALRFNHLYQRKETAFTLESAEVAFVNEGGIGRTISVERPQS